MLGQRVFFHAMHSVKEHSYYRGPRDTPAKAKTLIGKPAMQIAEVEVLPLTLIPIIS